MSEPTDIQPVPTPAPTEVVTYEPSPVVHQTTPVGALPLASERVILESPMSFVGSARRIWRWAEGDRSG